MVCYYCRRPGHFRRDCQEWLKTDKGKEFLRFQKKRRKRDDSSDDGDDDPGWKARIKSEKRRKIHRAKVAKEMSDKGASEASSNESDRETSLMAIQRSWENIRNRSWIVDSGATRHMTNERSIFEKISPTDTMVGVANDGIVIYLGTRRPNPLVLL